VQGSAANLCSFLACCWCVQGRGGEDWGIDLAQALEASLVGSPAAGGQQGLCLKQYGSCLCCNASASASGSILSCIGSTVLLQLHHTTTAVCFALLECICCAKSVTRSGCLSCLAGGSLDLKSLCVLPGKTCWVVYVDALLLNDGGNVLDALSIAARAALALTRIPKVGCGSQLAASLCGCLSEWPRTPPASRLQSTACLRTLRNSQQWAAEAIDQACRTAHHHPSCFPTQSGPVAHAAPPPPPCCRLR
jgi:hypothetical protein